MMNIWDRLAFSFEGFDDLSRIYRELEAEITTFKTQTGLECINHCKTCCQTEGERIEATVLETLPLSLNLWKTGQAEQWLDRLSNTGPDKPCLFFRGEDSSSWGCSCYEWRPLVCRLFGFAASLDKKGRPVFSLCKRLKTTDPALENLIQDMIGHGLRIPVYSHYTEKIAALNQFYTERRYPINEAIKRGLEIIGLKLELAGAALT